METDQTQLTLEQQFKLAQFRSQVNHMSHEQAQTFAVHIYTQLLIQENTYKQLIRQKWGIE